MGKTKPHLASQFRKAIMERSKFKNKGNKIGKPADKTAYEEEKKILSLIIITYIIQKNIYNRKYQT